MAEQRMGKLGPFQENTIVVGDCLGVMAVIEDKSIPIIMHDPPYNLNKKYGGLVNDNRDEDEYWAWYQAVAKEIYRVAADPSMLYVSCSDIQTCELRTIWNEVGFKYHQTLYWYGPNMPGKGSKIRWAHCWDIMGEPILLFLKGKRQHMLRAGSGFHTHNVFNHARPQRNFNDDLCRVHPTQKPVKLYQHILSRTPGGLVADFCVGSGASLIAADRLGRRWFGCDVNPEYVEMALERMEADWVKRAQLAMEL